jgi:spore maturation protein B
MGNIFVNSIKFISDWSIPFLFFIIPVLALRKKLKVYEIFVDGAKEGFEVAVMIIPYLVAILVAIGMFRASGALEIITRLLSPFTEAVGMPAETLPAALMRPLSGSGTLGIVTELMKTHGPDSFIGRLASTIYGSTETTFYVLAVYFGAVNIRKTRHAVVSGLIADVVGIGAAVFICRVVFS